MRCRTCGNFGENNTFSGTEDSPLGLFLFFQKIDKKFLKLRLTLLEQNLFLCCEVDDSIKIKLNTVSYKGETIMLPSIFGEKLFDDMLQDAFTMLPTIHANPAVHSKGIKNFMKTDVLEKEDSFELDIDLPGYKKEDVNIELDEGYLTISAQKNETNESNENGKYIRRERYSGTCSRSFFIGEDVDVKTISAKFEDGILSIVFPKIPERKEPEKKRISIA